jgi:hypothetical protein
MQLPLRCTSMELLISLVACFRVSHVTRPVASTVLITTAAYTITGLLSLSSPNVRHRSLQQQLHTESDKAW